MNAPTRSDDLAPAERYATHLVLNQAAPTSGHNAFSGDRVLAAASGREALWRPIAAGLGARRADPGARAPGEPACSGAPGARPLRPSHRLGGKAAAPESCAVGRIAPDIVSAVGRRASGTTAGPSPDHHCNLPKCCRTACRRCLAGRLDISLREVWTGGESLSDAMRRVIEESFGCPVASRTCSTGLPAPVGSMSAGLCAPKCPSSTRCDPA